MRFSIKNPKYFLILLFTHSTTSNFCQFIANSENNSIDTLKISKTQEILKAGLSVEIITSVLPKAKIERFEGKYELKSHIQSSYDFGINYFKDINSHLRFTTGLHFIIGKRNFYVRIPSADLTNSNPFGLLIEEKELWGALRMPLLIEKKISNNLHPFSIKAGFSFRYSGLMPEESFGVTRIDSNNQPTNVFSAEISARNNGKPWITLLGGISKSILLDNKNVLAVGLQADISTTYFLKSNYEITIPNQPITTGTYKINGSSLGLSVQYIFTNTNKQIVNPKKNRVQDTSSTNRFKKEDVLETYIFKSNHTQFNFALLSVFKAQLKNISGNHPVNTSMTPGLLLSFKYQINFNNKYSLITGPETMLIGRNFNTSFSKNDFSPPLVSDYSTKGLVHDLILSLPVLAERRWLYSKSKFLFADVGIRLNFSLGADSDIYSISLQNTSNGFYNVGGVNVYSNNDANPWLSFPFNAGHSWLLKNNNLLQLAIYSNISFTKYVDGTYKVDIPNQPLTEGNYSSTGSFVGLSLNYVFTNANYRLRKIYEMQNRQ